MLEIIKLAALDALDKNSLADICIGTVTAINPFKIMLEQKLELDERFFILTRNVTDFKVDICLKLEEETIRRGKIDIYNQLHVGEKVVLMKASGGQKYVVLDRIGKENNN